ncbi:unnamed protein product [Phaeothamnion confervicola]
MASVFLGDLDDFIQPTQACVNPLFASTPGASSDEGAPAGSLQPGSAAVRLVMESGLAPMDEMEEAVRPDLIKTTGARTATVSLNDCLACSGCVTSAETVLVQQQSTDKFLAQMVSGAYSIVVVSVSPQARASLAVYYGLTAMDTWTRIQTFLSRLGVTHVVDSAAAADLSLAEAKAELMERLRSFGGRGGGGSVGWRRPPHTMALSATRDWDVDRGVEIPAAAASAVAAYSAGAVSAGAPTETIGGAAPLPMLISACPGWVCYAEKTTPEAIPYMSTAKSPQQAMGALVKRVLPRLLGVPASAVLHAAVEPCYDRKLEASRKDFFHDDADAAEVDIVLTADELRQLIAAGAAAAAAAAAAAGAGLAVTRAEAVEGNPAAASGVLASIRGGMAASDTTATAYFRALPPSPSPPRPLSGAGGINSSSNNGVIAAAALDEAFAASATADGLRLVGAAAEGGGSGAYAEVLFRQVAREVYGVEVGPGPLPWRAGRNPDMRELSLDVGGGRPPLRFATAYGFRNIQAVVQRLRRGTCQYQLVEIMACPGGCLNGGGQIRRLLAPPAPTVTAEAAPMAAATAADLAAAAAAAAGAAAGGDPAKTGNSTATAAAAAAAAATAAADDPAERRWRLAAVSVAFHDVEVRGRPEDSPLVRWVYGSVLGGEGPCGPAARDLFHTRFHAVRKLQESNPMLAGW